jgi:energy-coupling factor transport system permease protein
MPRLERVNVFAKLAVAALVTVLAWFVHTPLVEAALAAAMLLVLLDCRLPQTRGFLRLSLLVFSMATASWLVNFLLHGQPIGVALAQSLLLALRLIVTTTCFYIAVETTSAGALLAACSAARLPGSATLVLLLIVGMIPLLREEYHRIGDTQRIRGLDVDRGPILARVRHALARGVPLLVQSYRAAEAVSLALSLYGFDPRQKRTTWREVSWLFVQPQLLPPAE